MTALAAIDPGGPTGLPAMVRRAADQLASASSAAEVLDARDAASTAYDAAKKAARIARAKGAHDELIAKAHRAQADALEIEAAAKRRLADEYDAAQDRGEVAKNGQPSSSMLEELPTVADIGLTHKDIHEARIIRDAEHAEPGIVRRTLDEALAANEEPTKATVRRAVMAAAHPAAVAADTPEDATPEEESEATLEGRAAPPEPLQARSGPRISIPEGMTAEQLCRRGMQIEADGANTEEAARQLGIGINTYRRMRDIVLLADKPELSGRDRATVDAALAMLNRSEQIGDAWALAQPVAERVWGAGRDTMQRQAREAQRVDRFEHALGIVLQSCAAAAELDLPYLPVDRFRRAVADLRMARRSLLELMERMEGFHA